MQIETPRHFGIHSPISVAFATLLVATAAATGCNSDHTYSENLLAKNRIERETGSNLESAKPLVEITLNHLFGTLENPRLPEIISSTPKYSVLWPIDAINRSAGEVGRGEDKIERGLYQKHCAVCHGLSGDGYGAAAATLAPYPRDFRRGTFKYGLAGQNLPPTHSDLLRIILKGVPGTSMPAMETLQGSQYFAKDAEPLAHYVRFLSLRGEVERRIWLQIIPETDEAVMQAVESEQTPTQSKWQDLPEDYRDDVISVVIDVAERWTTAEKAASPAEVPTSSSAFQWPEDVIGEKRGELLASVARGEELFRSEITACSQCHGEQGDGQGKLTDFDEWTKDWTVRAGIDPRIKEQWKPLRKIGLLKPVTVPARNLTLGVFRGGSKPHQIFDRIANGIDGTPMPAVARKATSSIGLTDEEIWDLVNYCQSLGYDLENLAEDRQ